MVKQGKRGLSLLMAFVLVFGLLPAGFASAQVPDNSAAGRTRPYDGVDFESMISDHSGIYYGAYDHAVDYIRDGGGFWNGSDYVHDGVTRPILWRAMGEDRDIEGEDSETITVLSEYVLDGQAFNASRYDEEEANYYVGSDMEEWLDDTVQTAFSGQEQDGMAGADVVTGKYDQAGYEIEDNDFPQETYQQLYLPWGNVPQFTAPKIYWSAGNEAGTAYEIADTGATFKGGVELDTAAGWQLRTPVYSDPNAVIGVWGVPGNDTETGNVPVNRPAGVRPLFQLDPTRVIFASEILANTTGRADATQADANYSAAAGGGKNFKLTVTSSQLRLDNLTTAAGLQVLNSTTLTVAPGADLALKGTATGNGNSVNYKIVADTAADRTIVGYGAAAADAEGSPQALTVPLKNLAGDDLAPGYYTVYIWEQLSKDKNSDEGSVPLSFRLKVWEPDPDADAFQIWNWDDLSQVMYQQEYNGVTKFELMQDLGIPKQTDTYGKGALSGRSGSEKFGWYGYQGYTGAEGDFSTGTKGSGSGWDGGRGWIPLGSSYSEYEDEDEEYDDKTMQMPFMGMFDGRGHTISGLWIDKQTVTNETGLFGYAEGAEIRNLSVALASAGVNGNHMTGALAGGVSGSGVENCHVLGGSVSGGQQQTMIGGLLGFAENSTIADSSAQAAVTGDWHLGGLVGYALDVSIQGCYATGNVTGNPGIIEATEIGGFIGTLSGFYDINGCFATGAVSGNYVLGGFIGRINAGADDPRDGITANGMFSIQNSYSMGKVTVNGTLAQNVSGFIGHFWGNGGIATIENCYATGDVRIEATARENWDGNQETMAGFVGGSWGGPAELRIANSYYAGTITAAEPDLFEILAFVGRQETWWGDWETGAENIGYVINNCYYDVTKNAGLDAAGTNVTADGITGKTTAQMTGTSMPGLLSSGVFVYRAPEGKFSFYPQLKRFAPTTGLLGSSSWSLSEMLSVESVKVGEGGSGGNPGNPGNPGEPNDPHDPPEPTDPPEPPDPDAYQIWNWADLADVINQVTGGGKTKFALMQDLGVPNEGNYGDGTGSGRDGDDKYGWYGYQGFTGDEADYTGTKGSGAGWQGTAGWFPIGEQTKPFTGSFDGRGHTISGLWINGPSGVGVGLFGYVTGVDTGDGEPTEIKNLNLSIAGEVKGDFKVGGLVGMLNGYDGESYIENCHVLDGAVSGGEVVGGLVGHVLYAELNEVSSQAAVSGDSMLGGLVGFAEGNLYVQSSYATGDVAGVTDAIGGLVGEVQLNSSGLDLEACFATGDVRGSAELGGLVGVIHGEGSGNIANSYAMGNVTAAGGEVFGVGGLVGFVEGDLYLYVYYCYARGDVTVQSGTVSAYEPDSIAGLVGGSAGSGPGRGASIYGAYYSGTVTAGGAFTPRAFIGSQGNADPESPSGFYDSTKNPGLAPAGAGVDDETITGKSTTAMTGAAFVSDNGDDGTLYGDDVFVHRAPEGSFAFYPQLVLFAPTAGKLGNNTWSLTEALSIESVKVGKNGSEPPEPPDPDAYQIWNWADLADVMTRQTGGKTKFALMQELGIPGQTSTYGDGSDSASGSGISGVTAAAAGHAGNEIYGWYGYEGFEGGADGDTSGYAGWTPISAHGWDATAGWTPIGTTEDPFTGTFDGRNYTINGLWTNRSSYVGLFHTLGANAAVKGLTIRTTADGLSGISVIDSHGWTGVLAAVSSAGAVIEDCAVYGKISNGISGVNGAQPVGGLVGDNWGVIRRSTAHVSAEITGGNYIGGLAGHNQAGAVIEDCAATGDVFGAYYAGGLAGDNAGTISDSYATGNVTARTATDVEKQPAYAFGGLVGLNRGSGVIARSCAAGDVYALSGSPFDDYYTGGLAGWSSGVISDSYATGAVTGVLYVGGLVGHGFVAISDHIGEITRSYAAGAVTGKIYVGGLIGHSGGSNGGTHATDSYATGAVTGGEYAGGLVGSGSSSYDIFTNCYASGAVVSTGAGPAGGLAGVREGRVATPVFVNCCFDKLTTGMPYACSDKNPEGAVGLATPREMVQAAGYAAWNVNAATASDAQPWKIVNGVTYPYLYWQEGAGAHDYALAAIKKGAAALDISAPLDIAYPYDSGNLTLQAVPGSAARAYYPDGTDAALPRSFTPAAITVIQAASVTHIVKPHLLQAGAPRVFEIWNWADLADVMNQQTDGEVTTFVLMQDIGVPDQPGTYGDGTGSNRSDNTKYGWYGYEGFEGGANGDTSGYADRTPATGHGWDAAAGWTPIGGGDGTYTATAPFTGSFDGQGHTINGLWMNTARKYNYGLFGYAEGAVIENLSLSLAAAGVQVTGVWGFRVGSLAGTANNSRVENCHALGGAVAGNESVGGLVGRMVDSTIANSSAQLEVSAAYYMGGLVGFLWNGAVSNSFATGDVVGLPTVPSAGAAGGLVGIAFENFTIDGSFATGNVSGAYILGGFIGTVDLQNTARPATTARSVTNSYAMGTVTAAYLTPLLGVKSVGGFVGHASGDYSLAFENCYATGDVVIKANAQDTAYSPNSIAGFIGGSRYNNGGITLTNCYSTGRITADYPDAVPVYAFAGSKPASTAAYTITNCYYDGDKSGNLAAAGPGTNAAGITAKTTEALTGETMPALLSSAFIYRAPEGDFSFYPQLGIFAPAAGTLGDNTWSVSEAASVASVTVDWDAPDPDAYQIWNWADLADVMTRQTGGKTKFALMQDLGIPGQPDTYGDGAASGRDDNTKYGWYGYEGFAGDPLNIGNTDAYTNGWAPVAGYGWDATAGWTPIGTAADPFTGAFDGRGHTINGLWMSGPDYMGLFHTLGANAAVKGLTIRTTADGLSIVAPEIYGVGCGILASAGRAGAVIEDCAVYGKISGGNSSTQTVGGLVGDNSGTIRKSAAHVSVEITGGNYIGGLAGRNRAGAVIADCASTGDVFGTDGVGGLAGWNQGTVSDSYATGAVTGEVRVGGLVGQGNLDGGFVSEITRSYAAGTVTGREAVGGLIGQSGGGEFSGTRVTDSYAAGAVTGVNHVGGLVGIGATQQDVFTNCYASGAVVSTGAGKAGGLVGVEIGQFVPTFKNCFFDILTTGRQYATDDDHTLAGAVGLWTDGGMLEEASYAAWDINADTASDARPWKIIDGVTYPYLYWQEEEAGAHDYALAAITESSAALDISDPLYIKYPYISGDITLQATPGSAARAYYPDGADAALPRTLPPADIIVIQAASVTNIVKPYLLQAGAPGIFEIWNWADLSKLQTPGFLADNKYAGAELMQDIGVPDQPGTYGDGEDSGRSDNTKYGWYGYEGFVGGASVGDVSAYTGWTPASAHGWAGASGWTPIGAYSTPFAADFYGNGKTVSGLWLSSKDDCNGLFGHLSGSVTALTIAISARGITGGWYTGGLAGRVTGATVSGVTVTGGKLIGASYTGGLIGRMDSGSVDGVTVTGGQITGGNYTGGLIGQMDSGSVSNAAAGSGQVTGGGYTGGLIGYMLGGSVSDVTGTNNVTADLSNSTYSHSAGGVIGRLSGGSLGGTIVNGSEAVPSTVMTVNTGGRGIGGVIGVMQNGTVNAELINYASVASQGMRVGGVIGQLISGTVEGTLTNGVFDTGATVQAARIIGGVIGAMDTIDTNNETGHGDCTATVTGTLTNYMSVRSQNNSAPANVLAADTGGVIGVITGGSVSGAMVNGGPGTGNTVFANSRTVGGVIGYLFNGNGGVISAASRNYMSVRSASVSTMYLNDSYVGGIIGDAYKGTVTGAMINGEEGTEATVTANRQAAGGIFGEVREAVISANSTNYMAVAGEGNYSGGIAGAVGRDISGISNSAAVFTPGYTHTNYGTVAALGYAGGIFAIYGSTVATTFASAATAERVGVVNTGAVSATYNYAAGYFASFIAPNGVIADLTNTAGVTGNIVGGIVGDLWNSNMSGTLVNGAPGTTTTITGNGGGGIAGFVDGTSKVDGALTNYMTVQSGRELANSTNATLAASSWLGGVIGRLSNTAEVKGTLTNGAPGTAAKVIPSAHGGGGGVIGNISGDAVFAADAVNYMAVEEDGPDRTVLSAGGIFGAVDGRDNLKPGHTYTNSGAVSGTGFVGGIIGKYKPSALTNGSSTYYFSNLSGADTITVTNSGAVTGRAGVAVNDPATGRTMERDGAAGGYFGWLAVPLNEMQFINLHNTVPVSGVTAAGGIVGQLEYAQIYASSNSAPVTASGRYAGGIVGTNGKLQTGAEVDTGGNLWYTPILPGNIVGSGEIYYVYNAGTVSADGANGVAGGLAGAIGTRGGMGGGEFCHIGYGYNIGYVSGGALAGGLAGMLCEEARLYNGYSAAAIGGTGTLAALAARVAVNAVLSDCYFDKDVYGGTVGVAEASPGAHEVSFTGLSFADMLKEASFSRLGFNLNTGWPDIAGCKWLIQEGSTYPYFEWQTQRGLDDDYSYTSTAYRKGADADVAFIDLTEALTAGDYTFTFTGPDGRRAFFPYGTAAVSYSAGGTALAVNGVTAGRRFVAGAVSESGIVGFASEPQTVFEIWNWADLSKLQGPTFMTDNGYITAKLMQDIGVPDDADTYGDGEDSGRSDNTKYGWYGYEGFAGGASVGDVSAYTGWTPASAHGWAGANGWTPIGGSSTPFAELFDGNGKTVSGLWLSRTAAYNGLFGHLSGSVDALTIAISAKGIAGGSYTGGLAGQVTGATVSEVAVKGGQIIGAGYTGGLIGYMADGALSGVTVTNNVTAVLTGSTHSVGGVLGRLDGGTLSGTLVNGSATASTAVTVTSGRGVGGIIGVMKAGTVDANLTNYASVLTTGSATGGIIGHLVDGTVEGTLTNGFFDTEAAVKGQGYGVGGVIGWIQQETVGESRNATVRGTLRNYMSVTCESPTPATTLISAFTGGIIGRITDGSVYGEMINGAPGTVNTVSTNLATVGGVIGQLNNGDGDVIAATSRNYMSVHSTNVSALFPWAEAGGIIGRAYSGTVTGTMINGEADTKATVTSQEQGTGGIFGNVYEAAVSADSTNYMKVESTHVRTGGIAGSVGISAIGSTQYPAVFTPGYTHTNYGTVTARATAGGIFGIYNSNVATTFAGTATAERVGVVNTGAVSAAGGAGGYFGSFWSPNGVIADLTNTVSVTGDQSGGIVGVLRDGSMSGTLVNGAAGTTAAITGYGSGGIASRVEGTSKIDGTLTNYMTVRSSRALEDSNEHWAGMLSWLGGVIGMLTDSAEVKGTLTNGAAGTTAKVIPANHGGGGGVVGLIAGNAVFVANAVNYMAVEEDGADRMVLSAGGIFGAVEGADNLKPGHTYTNSGAVSGTGYVGGIIGKYKPSALSNGSPYYFSNLSGADTITVTNSGSVTGRAGVAVNDPATGRTMERDGAAGGYFGLFFSTPMSSPYRMRGFSLHNTVPVSGVTAAGGIAGQLEGGMFELCSNTAPITASGRYAGGIVGINGKLQIGAEVDTGGNLWYAPILPGVIEGRGEIYRSYNAGTVSADGANGIAGGVAGANGGDDGSGWVPCLISDCYNIGYVSGGALAGGFVGVVGVNSSVYGCYSAAAVGGTGTRAAFAVSVGEVASVFACYFDKDVYGGDTGVAEADPGVTIVEVTGLRFADMLKEVSFSSDFNIGDPSATFNTWTIQEGSTYPYLAWQAQMGLDNDYSYTSTEYQTGADADVAFTDITRALTAGDYTFTFTGPDGRAVFFPYGTAAVSYSAGGTTLAVNGVTAGRRFVAGAVSESGIVGFFALPPGFAVTGTLYYDGFNLQNKQPAYVYLYTGDGTELVATVEALRTGDDPAEYVFEDVAPGTYRIVAYKKNHTRAYVYNLVVTGGDVALTTMLVIYAGDFDIIKEDPWNWKLDEINSLDRALITKYYEQSGAEDYDLDDDGELSALDRSYFYTNFWQESMVITLS